MGNSTIKTATTFSGVQSYPNVLSQVQPGALAAASNLVVDKPGTLSVRRGLKQWSSGSHSGKATPSRFFQAEQAVFGFFTADGLPTSSGYLGRCDTPNVTAFLSTLVTPPPGNAIHSFQANNNTFLSTDDGIYKLMALYGGGSAGDLVPAGVPFALDTQAALVSPQSGSVGFLAGGYATAYRVLWGYTDPAGNVSLGAPSPSVTVQNPLITGPAAGIGTSIGFAGVFAVTLGYTPGATVSLAAYAVQGSSVAAGTLAVVNGSSTATFTISPSAITVAPGLPYFGPSGANITIVIPVTVTAVAGTTLTISQNGRAIGSGAAVYENFAPGAPASLTGATVISTVSSSGGSSITVAGGTWSVGTAGVINACTIATAQANTLVTASGSDPQVGDLFLVPGTSTEIAVTAVSPGASFTLAAFPAGLTDSGGTSTFATQLARSQNVSVSFTVPQEINNLTGTAQTLAVFYQVYRSYQQLQMTTGIVPSPTDNMQLAYQASVTGTFTTANNIITVVDLAPDATLGAALYTSPNQQGILASQYPPPVASDATYYSNSTLLANTYLPASVSGQLLGVGGVALSSVAYVNGSNIFTVTPSTTSMVVGGRIKILSLSTEQTITAILSSTTVQIDHAPLSTGSSSGTYVPPGSMFFNDAVVINGVRFIGASLPSGNTQFLIASNGTATENINSTVQNFARTVNSYFLALTGAGNANEQVTVTPTSTASGQAGLFTIQANRGLGAFSVQQQYFPGGSYANVAIPFIQGIPVGPTTYSPTNQQNALYFSASNQPDAVPLTNFIQVGSPNYPIQRVVAIPGSCLIFKPDGVYQLTGNTPATFAAQLFNNTVQLLANESVAVLQSSVMAYTTQGVVTIANGNVQIVSMAINDDLVQLAQLPAFASTAFGVAQEKERRYLLFAPTLSSDTLPTQAFAYNVTTNAWTKWVPPGGQQVCGLVNIADQLLYLGCTSSAVLGTPAVFQERAGTLASAYGDESFTSSSYSVLSNAVTFTGLSSNLSGTFGAGTAVVTASGTVYVATGSSGTSTTLTLNFATTPALSGAVTVVAPTVWSFTTIPVGCDDAGTVKQFQEFAMDAASTSLGSWTATVGSDYYSDPTALVMTPRAASGAGVAVARQLVTRGAARGHTLQVTGSGTLAQQTLNLVGLTLQWVPQQTMRSK